MPRFARALFTFMRTLVLCSALVAMPAHAAVGKPADKPKQEDGSYQQLLTAANAV